MNLHQMNLGSMLADVTTQQHASGCTMCTFGNKIVKAFLEGANVTDTVTIHRKYPLATHHFTVTLQAISGLSPTTSVISTLPYYEDTLTSLYSVTEQLRLRIPSTALITGVQRCTPSIRRLRTHT